MALAALAAILTFVGTAGSVQARSHDAWVTSRTVAAQSLSVRFKNISSVNCAPDRTSATQVFGTTRYWQRFWCSGGTYEHVSFRLRFKTTGQCGACWTITNLSGVTVNRLRVRQASAASTSTSTGSTASCPSDYYRNSYGHCVLRPTSNPPDAAGATALCVDGTYSYSEHASGTCSHHGGVARWINHP
ncbi:MAG: DUF3761 domain-containing protein [Gaiellaceae bacterium]